VPQREQMARGDMQLKVSWAIDVAHAKAIEKRKI
jgi:hypothetical protein